MSALCWYQFPAPAIFSVTGRDATRYLNARLTNDIKTLPEGGVLRAAQLNPQGRTQGLFLVHALSVARDQSYILACDGGDRAAVMQALRQYIVADRVTVTDESETHRLFYLAGSVQKVPPFLEPLSAVPRGRWGAIRDGQILGGISIRPMGEGFDLLARSDDAGQFIADELNARGCRQWAIEDFSFTRALAGCPAFPDELGPDRIFLEAEQRDAVSFRKGCYVGQEVLEKVDSFGSVPRSLLRFETPAGLAVAPGDSVGPAEKPGDSIGTIVSVYGEPGGGRHAGFVSVRSQFAENLDRVALADGEALQVFRVAASGS